MTKYKEVARKATVGERIKIVNAQGTFGDYGNGDVMTVTDVRVSGVNTDFQAEGWSRGVYVFHDEYVVLEPKPELPAFSEELTQTLALFVRENADSIRKYIDQIEGKEDASSVPVATRALTRAEVIEKARKDVAALLRIGGDVHEGLPKGTPFSTKFYVVDFVVNREKRTVSALVSKGRDKKRKPDAVGIAKCAPGDVFHAEIGKAIALRKALSLEIPLEYANTPQPGEKRVGMWVNYDGYRVLIEPPNHITGRTYGYMTKGNCGIGSIAANNGVIIDDTDVDYAKETA